MSALKDARPPVQAKGSSSGVDHLADLVEDASPNAVHFRMTMASLGCLVGCGQLACLARFGG